MQYKLSTAKPCNECPFVKNRMQGYIGPYESAAELHTLATMDGVFPCHKTMMTPEPTNCRGIALYRRKICKMQDDDKMQEFENRIVDLNQTEEAVPAFKLVEYHGR